MSRLLALLPAVLLLGCGAPPPAEPPLAEMPLIDEIPIDFSTWPKVTEKPYRVHPEIARDCAAPTPSDQPPRGPHAHPAIIVRTNPPAFHPFRTRGPFSPGAVIVKEKHDGDPSEGPPVEFAAMVKKKPGYDPEHGDWEYVVITTRPERTITRGKLSNCIECHERARATDYLFRTYLPER